MTEASVDGSQQQLHDDSSNIVQSSIAAASTPSSLVYEAKDAIFDASTVLGSEHADVANDGATKSYAYIDMGGMGSWVEFHVAVDHDVLVGSSSSDAASTPTNNNCILLFRYANGASNRQSRPCSVSVNGVLIRTLSFPSTISWNNWRNEHIVVENCFPVSALVENQIIRLTATTEEGGPNINRMEWTTKLSDDDSHYTLSSSQPPERRECNYGYNKLPEGQITYGLDDGGCYLCTQEHSITTKISTNIPSSGKALTEQCQELCDADSRCLAYTVARAESLPPQLYRFGQAANCCLERTMYPPEAYLHNPSITIEEKEKKGSSGMLSNRRNNCQLDSMCWNRYEKIIPDEEGEEPCAERMKADVTKKKRMCTRVWEPTTYTKEDIQNAIDFIKDGCQYPDNTYLSMLDRANARCKNEIVAESLAISIIVHSSGMMTYVTTVGQTT